MASVGTLAERFETPSLRHHRAVTLNLTLPCLLFVTFYAVLANIPYWVASHTFGFSPLGWFCVDYTFVGLVALVVPRFVSAVLILITIFIDLLCGVCMSYFLPVHECLESLGVAHELSATRRNLAIVVVLLALGAAGCSALLPANTWAAKQRRHAAMCLIASAALMLGTDSLSFRFSFGRFPALFYTQGTVDGRNLLMSKVPRFARIPVLRLVRLQSSEGRFRTMEMAGAASVFPIPSATGIAIRSAGIPFGDTNRESPNLVLVVVESWGLSQDSPLKQALVQGYTQTDLLAKYDVLQGIVPFYGSTIAGEARELCGSGFGFHLLVASTSDLKSCVPTRLAAFGYDTIAMHGMTDRMFDRAKWYRTIGFKERWFNEQFKQDGLPDCMGAFVGTCDADIASLIAQHLREQHPQPYFIHWMTLNSHLPVLVPAPLKHGAPCLAAFSLVPNSALCSWYQLIENVHQSVAQIALGDLARPTVFVIVGDHAPPFGNLVLRSKFSQTDVPYVILMPRSYENYSKSLLAGNAASSLPRTPKPSRAMP